MPDSPKEQTPEFSEGYDFPDGNVVVSVTGRSKIEQTHGETSPRKRQATDDETPEEALLFRVHKFVLASYSTVFSDMFVVGASSASAILADLPVVQLQDKPDDILNLFRFIYKPETIPRGPFTRRKFAFDASLLRLSDKYDMPRIKDAVLPDILSLWPQTLHDWDQREKQRKHQNLPSSRKIPSKPEDEGKSLVDPTSAIRLGRDFPLPQILPSAFYALASLPANNRQASVSPRYGPVPDLEPLDRDDFVTLFNGQTGLRNCMTKAVEAFWINWCCPDHDDVVYPSGPDGEEPWDNVACPKEKVVGFWNRCRNNLRAAMISPRTDVFGCLSVEYERIISEAAHPTENICQECLYKISNHLMRSRLDIWMKLPELFGLEIPDNWGN